MSFQVTTRYKQAAAVVNKVPSDKFSPVITRILQKLHIKNVRLFNEEEENQLKTLFQFSEEELKLTLDCLCYTYEQAAFTSTGPEPLYDILLTAGFDEPHAKVIGRAWATEAADYINKLKDQSLNYASLVNVDYQLNMVTGQSSLSRQQEPLGVFEFTIKDENLTGAVSKSEETNMNHNNEKKKGKTQEKMQVEFTHAELYDFFNQLEHIQQQLDRLNKV